MADEKTLIERIIQRSVDGLNQMVSVGQLGDGLVGMWVLVHHSIVSFPSLPSPSVPDASRLSVSYQPLFSLTDSIPMDSMVGSIVVEVGLVRLGFSWLFPRSNRLTHSHRQPTHQLIHSTATNKSQRGSETCVGERGIECRFVHFLHSL